MTRLVDRSAAAAAVLVLLTTAACGGDTGPSGSAERARSQSQEASAQQPQKSSAQQAATTIVTATSEFGEILVDDRGMTVYMFNPDEHSGRSVCDAKCLAAWPIVKAPAEAGQGVDDSLLSTTKATNGQRMAVYNDWPLYYFVEDEQPGDVRGQAAGEVWWVMSPGGRPIRQMP